MDAAFSGVMSSPRKRLSLGINKGSNKQHFSPLSPTSPGISGLPPVGFSLAAAQAGSKLRKGAGKQWPYAPRSARYRLVEAREACGSTPAQFAQAISALLAGDAAAPVNQQQLLAMEAGFALVPAQVFAAVERLFSDHQSELARQEALVPGVLSGGEYPYQEPMEGCAATPRSYQEAHHAHHAHHAHPDRQPNPRAPHAL